MGKALRVVIFWVLGVLFLILAGLYGAVGAWAHFGFSLVVGAILLIFGQLESEYQRFMRRLDELKDFIASNRQQAEKGENAQKKVE